MSEKKMLIFFVNKQVLVCIINNQAVILSSAAIF